MQMLASRNETWIFPGTHVSAAFLAPSGKRSGTWFLLTFLRPQLTFKVILLLSSTLFILCLILCLLLIQEMSWFGFGAAGPAAGDPMEYPELSAPATPADYQALLDKTYVELLKIADSNDGWNPIPLAIF